MIIFKMTARCARFCHAACFPALRRCVRAASPSGLPAYQQQVLPSHCRAENVCVAAVLQPQTFP